MPQQGSGHAQQLPLACAQVPAALREHSIQATLGSNIHTLFKLVTSEAHPCKHLVEPQLSMLSMDICPQRRAKTQWQDLHLCRQGLAVGACNRRTLSATGQEQGACYLQGLDRNCKPRLLQGTPDVCIAASLAKGVQV